MKKKILAGLLAALSVFTFVACEESADESKKSKSSQKGEAVFQEEEILPQKSAEEKRALNIFLSNFSEAYYMKGSDPISGDEGKIDFAFTHVLLNSPSELALVPDYDSISAEKVDEVLEKYFGESVPHKTPKSSRKWQFRDGNFITRIPGGDSYGAFSVATGMKTMKDGNFEVSFHIYQLDGVYGGNLVTDMAAYSLSDAEAAAKYQKQADGTAVLKAKEYKGKQTYELVSYEVNYIV